MASTSTSASSENEVPYKQIRAQFDGSTITVYQAYNSAIASAAVSAQKLNASPQFKIGSRMTWIKPSWSWMLYRAGYSYKDPGQERILAIKMRHQDFLGLLESAVLTSHSPPHPCSPSATAAAEDKAKEDEGEAAEAANPTGPGNSPHTTNEPKKWRERGRRNGKSNNKDRPITSQVKVQWDPERSVRLERLPHRSIQIGIPGSLTTKWVEEMIVSIEDVTEKARTLKQTLDGPGGKDLNLEELISRGLVPIEKEFVVPGEIRKKLRMDLPSSAGGDEMEREEEVGEE